MTQNESATFEKQGPFLVRNGKSRERSEIHSNKKLCFVSNDKDFLQNLLADISKLGECYFVKLTDCPRDGMYLGRCFFVDEDTVGKMWAKYKQHPKLMCSVQDDDFCNKFREHVISYKDKGALA